MTNPQLISLIKKYSGPYYFISPHLDDAIFSAGGLITSLVKHYPVKVINVFTSAGIHPQSTLSAKKYLSSCQFSSATDLYLARVNEDLAAFSQLKIKPQNLGFIDGLWRMHPNRHWSLPELNAIYPFYRHNLVSTKPSPADAILLQKLARRLTQAIPPRALVFAPLAIGSHIDHVIVRNICSLLPNPIIYWADYPYHQTYHPDANFIALHNLSNTDYSINSKNKNRLIWTYQTQAKAVFGQIQSPLPPEKYYLSPNLYGI